MENTQMKKVQSITLGNLRRSQLTIYSFEQLSADNYFCKEAPLCMFDRVLQQILKIQMITCDKWCFGKE